MDYQYDSWITLPASTLPDASMQAPSRPQPPPLARAPELANGVPASTRPRAPSSPTYYPPLDGPPPALPHTTPPPVGSRPRYSSGTPYPSLSLSLDDDPITNGTPPSSRTDASRLAMTLNPRLLDSDMDMQADRLSRRDLGPDAYYAGRRG